MFSSHVVRVNAASQGRLIWQWLLRQVPTSKPISPATLDRLMAEEALAFQRAHQHFHPLPCSFQKCMLPESLQL